MYDYRLNKQLSLTDTNLYSTKDWAFILQISVLMKVIKLVILNFNTFFILFINIFKIRMCEFFIMM